jgi:hypothetical protein
MPRFDGGECAAERGEQGSRFEGFRDGTDPCPAEQLERVCCLLVLNSVISTPQWIQATRQRTWSSSSPPSLYPLVFRRRTVRAAILLEQRQSGSTVEMGHMGQFGTAQQHHFAARWTEQIRVFLRNSSQVLISAYNTGARV